MLTSDPSQPTPAGASDGATYDALVERALHRVRTAAGATQGLRRITQPQATSLSSGPESPTSAADPPAASGERQDPAPSGGRAGWQLFRNEALADRQTQWLGTVLLASRRSDHLFTLCAVLAMLAILALLAFGQFTRKARVAGWLVPQQGLVRVFAPQPGVVAQLYVREGAPVHQGEHLLRLSGELQSTTLGATQAEIVRRLTQLRDALHDEQRQQERLLAQQQRNYASRLATLSSELEQVKHDIATMKQRVALAVRNATANRNLREQGYVSEQQLQTVEADRLEQEQRLGALERQQIGLARERMTLEGELNDLPVRTRAALTNIERDLAAAEQELAQAEARREIVVPAPQNGTVTAILVEEGGHANISAPLLSIVPPGANLEAHLYSPSRAVGFVRPGQHVLLRYQAYPYQKFGHYEGTVANISRSAVSPGELPPQLAGLAGPDPVYLITVTLARQTIAAYGRQVELQPGMQLEADIALETRRLYEWLLDPLYTVTGKWHS
jgi:membrane fusion protein